MKTLNDFPELLKLYETAKSAGGLIVKTHYDRADWQTADDFLNQFNEYVNTSPLYISELMNLVNHRGLNESLEIVVIPQIVVLDVKKVIEMTEKHIEDLYYSIQYSEESLKNLWKIID
jgi:hypothetical protein